MASSQPAKRFDWNNLRVRVLSGVILAPLALAAVWFGDAAFLLLMAIGVALLTIEWGAMCDHETPARAAVVIASAILVAIFAAYLGHPWLGWLLVGLGALVGAIFTLLRGRIDRPADIAFGILYIGAPAVALIWLRGSTGGRSWTLLLMAVVWAADIAAFLVGSALKGPKLWPRFSPNKTWTGFFGGLLGGALAAIGVAFLPLGGNGPTPVSAVWIGLLTALAAMGGDLWESMLKRRFGVKDSGDLIPGHGGLLDRVDGLMFAAVLVAAVRLLHAQGLFA
jgi:phosphatidate cytidylyltransferase